MLFDPAGESYQVSLQVALGVAATMALMVGLVVAKLVQVRRAEVVTGQEELIGQVGIVRQELDPVGLVFVHGELWRAKTAGEPIAGRAGARRGPRRRTDAHGRPRIGSWPWLR